MLGWWGLNGKAHKAANAKEIKGCICRHGLLAIMLPILTMWSGIPTFKCGVDLFILDEVQ